LPSPFALVGGDATGRLVVTAGDGGFSLRSETPLAATGISVRQGDRMLLEHLDLSLALSGEAGAQGWKLRWSPLAVDGAGRRLATIEATASRAAGADEPVKVSGTWKADLQAVAQAGSGSALGWLKARSASGEFSGTVGSSPEGDGTITVIGSVPDHTVSASIHADLNGDELEFRVPAKISLGADVSDLTLEGTLVGEKQGARVDVKLSGEHVVLRHLRLLALPLAALGGADVAGAAGTPDRVPFWGGWAGRLAVSLDRLRTEDTEVTHVGGLLDLERGSIRLLGGRWGRGIQNVGRVEGSITFDGSAEAPYALKAAATLNDVDAASLYPPSQLTEDHQFEGHFTISETLAGSGKTAADLADRTEETFHLSSKAGIVRILKTSVAEAIPEASTPVADTLGTVGSFVGSILGKKESMDAGKNTVSKNAQAVIDFTNQVPEIGFDEASITAVRAADGTFRIAALEVIAPEEHLTGTGRIGYAPGLSLARRPLTLDLQVGVKGQSAELLRKAGLLSSQKDALGYQIADQAISFVGSLGNVDASQWHEWLVKAATRKPEPAPKKGGG
jgi:hypothetical protein